MNSLHELGELLRLAPVQRGGLALALSALGLPIVGVVIIGLDIIAVRFAMMHVALFGIAIGLVVGLDPLVIAVVLCGLSGAALTPLARSTAGLSGAMGLLMSMAVAAALLMLSISGVNANGAFALLWGSILATNTRDVVLLGVLAVLIPTLLFVGRRQLALLLHDRELALCSGIRVQRLTFVLLLLVGVAVAGAIRLTGALLVDALTLLPALAARRIAASLTSMVVVAVAVGAVVNLVGFGLALIADLPPGPVLVLTAGAIVLVVHLLPDRRNTRWALAHGESSLGSGGLH